jgi:hypothetical protein
VLVFVVVVFVVFSSGCDVSVVSRFAVCVVRHPASTRVPFHVLLDSVVVVVVVCVVLVGWSDCAHRKPANNGITATLVSFFIVPSCASWSKWRSLHAARRRSGSRVCSSGYGLFRLLPDK